MKEAHPYIYELKTKNCNFQDPFKGLIDNFGFAVPGDKNLLTIA